MKTIMLMALTLDGKIARNDSHFPDWTGKADKRLFVRLSKRAGVVIMGSKTYDTIGRPLPGRKNIVFTRNPERISNHADLVYTADAPQDVLSQLSQQGYTEAVLAGGTSINNLFAVNDLIDEIVVTISPLIFGSGISMFSQALDMQLTLTDMARLDRERVMLTYRVNRI